MTTKTGTKTATMDTKKLQEALQKLAFPKHKSSLLILKNIYAEFTDGKTTFTTTDLERVIRVEIDSANTDSFSALLPKTQTNKFVSGTNGKVSISQGGATNKVTLSRDGIGDLNLTVPLVTEFPKMPKVTDNLQWHTLDGKWFCSMLRIIAIACAEESGRPVLNGIVCNDGAMAAADGFRLHLLKDSRLTFGLGDKQAIIPLDTINLIQRLFRKEEKLEVAFEIAKDTSLALVQDKIQRVHCRSNNVSVISQVIQGTYPNYNQLVPNSFGCKVSFSSPLMAQRLNMIDEKTIYSGIVRYVFETSEHGEQICSLSAKAEDECEYKLSCPIKFEGKEAKIAFSHRYFMDAIKPFSMCNLEVIAESSPGKFTGDIEGLTIVVMPMFVQW